MRYVIIRDDDTSAVTPSACLEQLYRPFLDRGLPVNLAVIPEVRTDVRLPDGKLEGFLTAGGRRSGRRANLLPLGQSPDIVSYLRSEPGYHVLQHGCHHDYLEFGGTDRSELAKRLDRGRQRLLEAGFGTPDTFVAPYDRISRGAYAELAKRFKVISTGWFELGRIPRRWWPAYLSKKVRRQPHWRANGTALLSHPGCLLSYHRPYRGMLESVKRSVESRQLTVLVTHWWEYFRTGDIDEPFLGALHSVADWLAGRSDIRVVPFSAVAAGKIPLS